MSVPVEHEKRKKEILEHALDVFIDEGYEDTTFRKIAERCGITRTILYLYFKNKREIFIYSIKQFMETLEREIRSIVAGPSDGIPARLLQTVALILESSVDQRRLLIIIFDYLNHIRKSGGDPDERVRRRTIRMRHILASMVIEGIRAGELADVPVKETVDILYALIEASVFRLVVLGRTDTRELSKAASLFLDRITKR
ncbi:MAG: TetR/AcrR family transcriptional regulator [Spirochaetes bacterium]|nr:TetR/AcrR family transcriptional regulator [Spirochaetota bacterium]